MTTWDVVVVGGGIVGVATADALARAGRRVIVLEAADRLAPHQSGHNSGVIHSGLYYRPGSHKAVMCAAGRDAMYAFCEEAGVPTRRCGKLVVATREVQLPGLATLYERGIANGLRDLQRLGPDDVRARDPEVRAIAGLWVSETGVVDFAAVTRALAGRAQRSGAEIRINCRVLGAAVHGRATTLRTSAGPVQGRLLVNCAGLQSDRVARLAGVDPGVAIVPFRGEYYELRAERAALVRNLVYPVPDPELPFLGVHFTRRIDGRVEAGPNAVLALHREGYARWGLRPADVITTVAFPGFWRMTRRFWRTGLAELARSLSKRRFVRALQELVPAVEPADLQWGGCGIRAQAIDRAGRLLDDFHIVEGDASVHVVNAPSPAATASLAIAAHIAQRVARRLDD